MPTKRPLTLGDLVSAVQDAVLGPDYPDVPESPYAQQAKMGFDWYAPPQFLPYLREAAERYQLNPRLLDQQFNVESRYNPRAKGKAGERGIAQLKRDTAADLGVTNRTDPRQSILGGAKYMAQLLKRFDYDPAKALGAYNIGPGNMRKGKKQEKAQAYVSAVLTPKRYGD